MFAFLMEEEAEIVAADDEEHLMMLSCLMALYAATMQSRDKDVPRLDAARASRGRDWTAIVFSTPTTSPTSHCMIIESEREHPVYDPEPYHRQGFLPCIKRSEMQNTIANCKMI
jgi:hypothetical protein